MQKKAAIIIPVYNEASNLKILIPNIFRFNKNVVTYIVDDNSVDNTQQIIFSHFVFVKINSSV